MTATQRTANDQDLNIQSKSGSRKHSLKQLINVNCGGTSTAIMSLNNKAASSVNGKFHSFFPK